MFYILFIFYFRIDRHILTSLAKKIVILIPARVLLQTTAIYHCKIDSFWMLSLCVTWDRSAKAMHLVLLAVALFLGLFSLAWVFQK